MFDCFGLKAIFFMGEFSDKGSASSSSSLFVLLPSVEISSILFFYLYCFCSDLVISILLGFCVILLS